MGRRDRIPKSTEKYLSRTEKSEWNTAIYARLSDENNGFEDDRSLQNQIKFLETYIVKHPELVLVDTYADNGQSGLSFERAEFGRMLEDVKNGRINCIVVKDLSRFGRNHVEAGFYLEKIFPQLDVRFVSVNDGFDSMDESENDSLILPVRNMINEMYARETQRKILTTFRAKEKSGERPFWSVPYGYMVDPACNYHLIPDRNTSGYVRLIFDMKSKGYGLTAIADHLNQTGVPTPLEYRKSQGKYMSVQSSGKWDHVSVQKVLCNRTYTGATVYNTTCKGNYTVIPDTHEALVDVDVFEAILKELTEKGKRKSEALKNGARRAEKYPNVLKGIFFCGNCGYAMLYDRMGNTRTLRNFRYRCGNYNNYRKNDPDAPPCAVKISSVPEQAVYKFILDEIRKQLRAGFELEMAERSTETAEKTANELAALKKQEGELKEKLRILYEESTDNSEYCGQRINCREKLYDVCKRISELESDRMISCWIELKSKLFADEIPDETAGIIRLSDTSSVEIISDDKPDMVERLLRKGVTEELLSAIVERICYSVDGSFTIRFKCDFSEKPEEGEQD